MMKLIIVCFLKTCLWCPYNVVVIGKRYESQADVYTYPYQATVIQQYLVSSLSANHHFWNINDIECKLVRLPTSPSQVSYPTRHQDIFFCEKDVKSSKRYNIISLRCKPHG